MLMKSRVKAASAIVLSVAVFAALIFLIVFAFQKIQDKQLINQVSGQTLKLSASFKVTAETGCMGTVRNSYISAKTGVNSGAQAISADISFRKDGAPVLAAQLPQADNNAVTLERVFNYLAGKKDVSMVLNLKQVTNLPEIERLASENGLINRLTYTGIDEDQVPYLQYASPNIHFYIDSTPQKSKLNDAVYCAGLAENALSCSALGINCDIRYATKTFIDTVHAYGLLFSVNHVEKEADMYRMLSLGVDNISTKSPDLLLQIISGLQAKAAQH